MVQGAIPATPPLLGRRKPTESCKWLRHSVATFRRLAAPLNQVLDARDTARKTLDYEECEGGMENTVIGGVVGVMIAVAVIFIASRKNKKNTDTDNET